MMFWPRDHNRSIKNWRGQCCCSDLQETSRDCLGGGGVTATWLGRFYIVWANS